MISVKRYEKTVHVEEITPSVIGNLLYKYPGENEQINVFYQLSFKCYVSFGCKGEFQAFTSIF